jgi:hypothetical protein
MYLLLLAALFASSCYVSREPQLSLSVVYLEHMDTIMRYNKPPQLMYKWKSLDNGQYFYSYGDLTDLFHPGVSMYAFVRK